jgi:hypothetical protein
MSQSPTRTPTAVWIFRTVAVLFAMLSALYFSGWMEFKAQDPIEREWPKLFLALICAALSVGFYAIGRLVGRRK